MNILINVPNLFNTGEVSALYNILKLNQFKNIQYFHIQGRIGRGKLFRVFELCLSYLIFK